MIKLDVLKAKYGDCLLLHAGRDNQVRILIDGGPSRTFEESLRPRLKALAGEVDGEVAPLLDLVLVSHIDADHIEGLIKLLEHEQRIRSEGGQSLVRFQDLWHNSFTGLVPEALTPIPDGSNTSVSAASVINALDAQLDRHLDSAVVMASVGQGNTFTELSRFHRMNQNAGGSENLMRQGMVSQEYAPLKLHVLGPKEKEIRALRKKWVKAMQKIHKENTSVKAQAVQELDTAVANLSSIVVMVESEFRRLLLTGDARGDFILNALDEEGFVENDVCEVDVFKWPHHGSIKNLPQGIFKSIVADHHVISANGRHDNPDIESIELFVREHQADQATTLHMTYGPDELEPDHGNAIRAIIKEATDNGHQITLNTMSDEQPPWLTLSFD